MVVGRQQHLVAGLEIDAGRDEVVRLARVAGDDDFFRRHAQELGEQLPRVLASVAELRAVVRAMDPGPCPSSSGTSSRAPDADEGHRFAALSIVRSFGMTN